MRNHLRWLFLFLIGVAFIGCQDDLNINSPVNNQGGSSFSLNKISPAIETQTKDLDLTGSKIILAGIGTYVNGTGTISVNVPSGTIKNVFLYWEGRHQASGSLFPNGDSQIKVNGVAIDGELIGKANQEGTNRGFVFRADVTSKGFVTNGANSLSVSDFVGAATIYDRADGVGVMVVVDDGSKASLEVRDGADWAYLKSDPTYPWLLVTEAQTFTFDASTVERKADLSLFVGDLGVVNGTPRPHHMEITVGDGAVQSIAKPFYNNSGPQWDTYTKELTIPAGVTKVKVQIFSDPDESATVQAASLLWFLTSLKISTPANLAAIGDRTWKDLDGDGIQDDGEPGFEGVKVELYTCAGDLVATQYTDANGNYLFTDLTPGSYSLQFYTPDGWAITLQDAPGSTSETDSDIFPETGKTICTDLTAGEVDRRWDAGYVQLQLKSKLGDFVWNDLNKNGVQENGEVGVPNVKVDLLDCSDNFIATTNTNEQGYYYFDNLNAGEYKVKFYLPNGYAFSPKDANGDDTKDSDAGLDGITDCINLPGGVEDLTWDAGIYLSTLNKLGDFVWHDKNVNGIQDAGEPGITGVKVELLSGNTVISTTTTDVNGKYEFSNLANGNYCVRVAASNYEVGGVLYSTAQTKWYATKKDQGSDNAKDSDAGKNESVCVTLNNNDDLTLDFGFYKTCVSVTKLADKKTAKPGETITYTFVVENCGDITLGGGVDLFDPLLNPTAPHKIGNLTPVHPGTTKTLTKTYCVTSKDCGDLVNTVKAVGHPVDGSANVEFSASVTVKIDCTAPAKLGDKVWLDKDNDGIQDYGEPGVHNVKVELYD
ncbi:MAG: hypothetical protein HXY50_04900, partial [Ignavibacteriaceae bacterium]|nr:hypothetical protein [Ignavibacteriaceae bacterium]